eukprot:PITA_23621
MARNNINLIIRIAMIGWYCWESIGLANAGQKAWKRAHATCYGDTNGISTMGGACGYDDMYAGGYGASNTAVSSIMFKEGAACGACYELLCDAKSDPAWCIDGGKTLTVTATNLCPRSGWCDGSRHHFDLSEPAFTSIAGYKAGIVPVLYRKVPCLRNGGVRFSMMGHAYYNTVVLSNVGGSGQVSGVWMKADGMDGWQPLQRGWGAVWGNSTPNLEGRALSFIVKLRNGKTRTFNNVIPPNWRFGQSFVSAIQF